MSRFAAVVLAGGGARRMGGAAKPARTVAGTPLLARVLAAVADARPRIVVGPGDLVPLLPQGVSLTSEEPGGGGPAMAAAAGLTLLGPAFGGDDLVAVLAADLPFLSPATIAALRDRVTLAVDGAVLVDDAGYPQWLCGVWRLTRLRSRVDALGNPAGRGMRDLVDGLRVERVGVTDPTRPPAWFDCDTQEDLDRAEEWAHGDPG